MPHLLKKLELNGFKSFAQKTILDFPAGITAIVGPNGSGKSNVIDAIRWLLGEREAKSLRGAKSEDLIFAGTEKRPRMGQGQASLYFENLHLMKPRSTSDEEEKGIWNSGLTEVTVSRQVSRDGNNQYFLNKSEVRLKDIIDFFAQARLGSKGLTVITQGNSDLFIRVSPRERREMIEEMLGLREYQIKKTDAERRLKNAEINLEKVNALIEEILPHLRSLKRQTGKWEKRGSLEEELKSLENGFFGSKLGGLQKELEKVEEDLKSRAVTEKELNHAMDSAEKRLKDLENNQPGERRAIQEIKSRTASLLEKRSALQKDLGRLEAQIEITAEIRPQNLAVPHEKLLSLTKRIREELREVMDQDESTLRRIVKTLLSEIEEVFVAAEKKVPTPPSAQDSKNSFSDKLNKLQKELKDLEDEMIALKNEEKRLESGQETFYEHFKKEMHASREAREKAEKWLADTRGLEIGKERTQMRLEELHRQISQTTRHLSEFKEYDGPVHHETELAEMERRMFRLRGELASIGEVDEAILKEASETEERYEFLGKESKDLMSAKDDLKKLIKDLNEKIKTDFHKALVHINDEFQKFFELMFGGGKAKLVVVKKEKRILPAEGEEDQAVETEPEAEEEREEGIEINLSLPKKRINSLEMLSGGERSLVGIAAIFALISVSPPPFLVLDEIDAPLDERNARRFSEMLKEFSKETQFIVVTHNRATMEAANVLYGVTLDADGTSKVLSMKME